MKVAISLIIFWMSWYEGHSQFIHPGLFSTSQELSKLSNVIESTNSLSQLNAYHSLLSKNISCLNFQHSPFETVTVVAYGVTPSELNFRESSQAAYSHTLQWLLTDDSDFLTKALDIINDWSYTFKRMEEYKGRNQQVTLEAAWVIPIWLASAEIIKHHEDSKDQWPSLYVERFDKMIARLVGYTDLMPQDSVAINWLTSKALANLAYAVYTDNETLYNKTIHEWYKLLPRAIRAKGELREICRDCVHAEYDLKTVVMFAEIASNQGLNLYELRLGRDSIPRIALGMEYMAKTYLGQPVISFCGEINCTEFVNSNDGGWKMAYQYYTDNTNYDLTFTKQYLSQSTEEYDSHFLSWSGLTHRVRDLESSMDNSALRITSHSLRNSGLLIYPVPSNGPVKIHNYGFRNWKYKIFDFMGREVSIGSIDPLELKTLVLPASGNYYFISHNNCNSENLKRIIITD